MTRFVDRGAVFAGYVGLGMAAVIVTSFVLVIPIEPVAWLLAPFAGILIGYYADSKADRRNGPWRRILGNAAYAGIVTAVGMALMLLVIKGIFFYADDGYRGDALGGRLDCQAGPACVYARYQAAEPAQLAANDVTDLSSFTAVYWREQATTLGVVALVTVAGALLGGILYGAVRPKAAGPSSAPAPQT